MTAKECYAVFGGNYEEALSRLMKDERIVKYLKKLTESQDYDSLLSSLENKNYEDAFGSVHNLKGVSLNLSITPLATASDVLCEALRGGAPTVDISGMLDDVKNAYEIAVSAIGMLD